MAHPATDEWKRLAWIANVQISAVLDIDAFTVKIISNVIESVFFKQED